LSCLSLRLAASCFDLENPQDLARLEQPQLAMECVCRTLGKEDGDLYFWNTHAGAELDLFWQARGQNWGVEFKYEDAPRLTRSMKTAVEDLGLERLWVVYPGKAAYRLSENIQVLPLADVPDTWNYG
jgi:predicted AAA+ superfamily ATPase